MDTGYNGPPRHHWPSRDGAPCSEWCLRYRAGKQNEELWNDPDLRIVPGFEKRTASLPLDYADCESLHAEQNALMFSDRRLREGGTIYVSSSVCGTCAKLIANSGLVEVVYTPNVDATHRNSDRWVAFMEQCELTVVDFSVPR